MISIKVFDINNRELYKLVRDIREEVFLVEQKVDISIEYEFEDEAIYFLVFDNNRAVATARYRDIGNAVKLERFAVLKSHRGTGVGGKMLQKVLDEVVPMGKEIYLNAQVQAMPYYEKYGFEAVGDLFYDANIEHYKMIYRGE